MNQSYVAACVSVPGNLVLGVRARSSDNLTNQKAPNLNDNVHVPSKIRIYSHHRTPV